MLMSCRSKQKYTLANRRIEAVDGPEGAVYGVACSGFRNFIVPAPLTT